MGKDKGEIKRILPSRNRSINSALRLLGVRDWQLYHVKNEMKKIGSIYDRLGGEEEILRIAKAAYREKIFQMHPDRNPECTREYCEKYSQRLNETYQWIKKVIKTRMGGSS